MSHEVPSHMDNYDNRTLTQYDLFNDEEREEKIMKKMRHLHELTKLANEGANKQQILSWIRKKQINSIDPVALSQFAQSDDPLQLEKLKQQMLTDISQYDLLATQFSLLWNINQDIKYIRELYELRRKQGLPFATHVVQVNDKPVVQLNLVDSTKKIPTGAVTLSSSSFRFPKAPVSKVTVKNRGTGTLYVGFVEEESDETTDIVVVNNENYTLEVDDPVISLINLRAVTSATTVDIVMER